MLFPMPRGKFAVIVKLTRTLSIVPIVLLFSYINERLERKKQLETSKSAAAKVDLRKIFPWFILFFLMMVAVKSTGYVPEAISTSLSSLSKFIMVMSLGAIGLKTNFSQVAKSGMKPMLHGFLISTLVVVVSFMVQQFLGQV